MSELHESLKQFLSFTYREPIELVVAMSMVARQNQMIKLAEELRVETDPLLDQFLEQAGEMLSPHMKRELEYFFDYDFFRWGPDMAFYASAFDGPPGETAEQWMNRLESTPPQETVSKMVRCAYNDKLGEFLQGLPRDETWSSLETLSEQVAKIEPSGDAEKSLRQLNECLTHPDEAKTRYMLLIRQFHRICFAPYAGEIRSRCEAAVKRYEELFRADPERFVHDFHKIDPNIYSRTAIHHVCFMVQVSTSQYNISKQCDWIIFGINNERFFGPDAARNKAEKFFKAFSDKRRLEFIRLLAERPLYGQELASELGITPAAVNYHANFLVMLDLIELRRSEHRLYYHVNRDKVKELLDLTAKVLLGEEKYGLGSE
jgi:DNA-binding transcriptional ArsR family regulator